LSASDTTARATASAVYRSGAWTVTMLMILSLMCALTMLADLRQAASSAATAKLIGSGSWPSSPETVIVTLYRLGGSCMPGTIRSIPDI